MADPARMDYETASFTLRPPRVVVLFRDDAHWRKWARMALAAVSCIWGGGGFLLVPYRSNGTVAAPFGEIVRAYDPDHIVYLMPTLLEAEEIAPGTAKVTAQDGTLLAGEELRDLLRGARGGPGWNDPQGARARDALARWCTPLQLVTRPDDASVPAMSTLRTDIDPRPLLGLPDMAEAPGGLCIAVDPGWDGDLMLSAAARCGLTPRPETGREQPSPEATLSWLLHPEDGVAQRNLLWSEYGVPRSPEPPVKTWLEQRAGHGLTPMARRFSAVHGAIVVGDSAADFALAQCYDRLFGHGVWLPRQLLDDPELLSIMASALELDMARTNSIRGTQLHICSASLDEVALNRVRTGLVEAPPPVYLPAAGSHLAANLVIGPPPLAQGLSMLGIADPFDVPVSVPVLRDDRGTIVAATPLTAPNASDPIKLEPGAPYPYWLVELVIAGAAMPAGRGLPPASLLDGRSELGVLETQLRSSRDGITYNPQTFGLVFSGQSAAARVARPKVRLPGLRTWIEEIAAAHGVSVRLSAAGTQSELVARRLGSRDELITLTRLMLPVLQRFKDSPEKQTSKVFTPGHGTLIERVTYPTLAGLQATLSIAAAGQLRDTLDRLMTARLLRRGLAVDCVECGRVSFIGIDDLGHQYPCPRCAAINELTASRWKRSSDEPIWHYDLHRSFRALMNDNAHVGLLAAARLRDEHRRYLDVGELEFVGEDGNAFAEIDLIALCDEEVVIAEAKIRGRLVDSAKERSEEAAKKLRVATLLQADRFVLATTAEKWAHNELQSVRAQARRGDLVPGFRVDVLAGLVAEQPETGALWPSTG